MKSDTKEKIFQTSKKLWFAKGYENTTMRDIASACGISIGNLTYHYPRKDDILMVYHDRILDMAKNAAGQEENGVCGSLMWIGIEYAFLDYIVSNPSISDLYCQVMNSPELRTRYIAAHDKLYQEWSGEKDTEKATAAMSFLEFGMMQMKYLEADFDHTINEIFHVHHEFLPHPSYDLSVLADGIALGKKFSSRIHG